MSDVMNVATEKPVSRAATRMARSRAGHKASVAEAGPGSNKERR